jgi:hypothetical protein
MIVEKQMECRLAGKTEESVLNPGRRGGKPAINRLSYGVTCFMPLAL